MLLHSAFKSSWEVRFYELTSRNYDAGAFKSLWSEQDGDLTFKVNVFNVFAFFCFYSSYEGDENQIIIYSM